MTQIRTKSKRDIKRERHPTAKRAQARCYDHLICAPLWPMHGVNLGTLLRTCEAVGACMVVPHYPWVPMALNKGYTINQRGDVHWCRPNQIEWLEKQAARDDTRIVAVELADEAVRLADVQPVQTRTIMVLGHEKTGIPDEAVEFLDVAIEIPMVGTGSTLNVAVAGSLALYKLSGLI